MSATDGTETENRSRLIQGGIVAVATLVAIGLFFLLLPAEATRRPLKPLPEPAAIRTISGTVQLISFAELSNNLETYRQQRIQVSGRLHLPQAEQCVNHQGPQVAWVLIADELQLNAVGYEALVLLLPEETQMTIEGVWRFYEGPLGCEARPAVQQLWYLAVERIIQPNPIAPASLTPNGNGADVHASATANFETAVPQTPASTVPITTTAPGPSSTVQISTPIFTTTQTAVATQPPVATVANSTPSATPIFSSTPIPTIGSVTETATAMPNPGTPSPTSAAATPLSTATESGGGFVTATPGTAYPPPAGTPTLTPYPANG